MQGGYSSMCLRNCIKIEQPPCPGVRATGRGRGSSRIDRAVGPSTSIGAMSSRSLRALSKPAGPSRRGRQED